MPSKAIRTAETCKEFQKPAPVQLATAGLTFQWHSGLAAACCFVLYIVSQTATDLPHRPSTCRRAVLGTNSSPVLILDPLVQQRAVPRMDSSPLLDAQELRPSPSAGGFAPLLFALFGFITF